MIRNLISLCSIMAGAGRMILPVMPTDKPGAAPMGEVAAAVGLAVVISGFSVAVIFGFVESSWLAPSFFQALGDRS